MKRYKKYKCIFFDIDGTLIKPRKGWFAGLYYKGFADGLIDIDPHPPVKRHIQLKKHLTTLLFMTGSLPTETIYARTIAKRYTDSSSLTTTKFHEYARRNTTDHIKRFAEPVPINNMSAVTQFLVQKGRRIGILSRPLIYASVNEVTVKNAGYNAESFFYCNGWDRSSYPKYTQQYYEEVCERINIAPDDCLHIGDDAKRDLKARSAGMDVYLLDMPASITTKNEQYIPESSTCSGTAKELLQWLKQEV